MNNFMDFSSDKVDVFLLLVDCSSSMKSSEQDMRMGLKRYKESFKYFAGANCITVSICNFSSELEIHEFVNINDLDIDYFVQNSNTALHYAITKSAEYMEEYMEIIKETKGIIPKGTFIVLSDGESVGRDYSRFCAENTIKKLNDNGITTVFVAFGDGITSEFGWSMGFQSTIDVTEKDELINFLGVQLSQSCKEQSKSMKSLGAGFFSKAVESNSNGFSQTSQQVVEDTDWFNDI